MTIDNPEDIRPGDLLVPCPCWNLVEKPARHLPNPVRVKYIRQNDCAYGLGIGVMTIGGYTITINVGWFSGIHSNV